MLSRGKSGWMMMAVALLSACASAEPKVVASNCDDPNGCDNKVEALHLDAVDILMVIDNSNSIAPQAEALKAELPRLLNAIVMGNDGDTSFPPANSVHVAVTTSDIGIGPSDEFPTCTGIGNDGLFVKPGEVGVSCEASHPAYLAYEGGAAPIATVDSVACVPLVFSQLGGNAGCGFEQPLEAALKSVWRATDQKVSFLSGAAHGSDENQGFLRDTSLLVVVVVTDEDDCSARDLGSFTTDHEGNAPGDANVRCIKQKANLYDVQRYVDGFKALRPGNDNVIFAVLGGIPAELVSDDSRSKYDFDVPEQVDAYYDMVLADSHMQEHIVAPPEKPFWALEASCSIPGEALSGPHLLFPPPRLVQVAKAFGKDGVLGSLCANDFGSTTGRLIHAIGERLTAASKH